MEKKRYTWLHLLGWLLYFAYQVIGIFFFPDSKGEKNDPGYVTILNTSYDLSLAATFYFCYALIYPNLIRRRRMVLAVLGCIASPFVFVVCRYLLEETFYPAVFGFRNYGDGTTIRWYIIDNIYRGVPVIALSAVIWGVQQAYRKERENKQLREEKMKAELSFLKSQINPHFLFNTLNYIYSLAYPVSQQLADAVIRLSQLMRYMLTDSADEKVSLEKELDYIRHYTEVCGMLFENHFFVDMRVIGQPEGKMIAPLLLVPFFENAFKHGVVNDPSKPVQIVLTIGNNELKLQVANAINKQQKDHSSGIGLPNVRRRLELIYPGKHELHVTDDGAYYKTELSIQL